MRIRRTSLATATALAVLVGATACSGNDDPGSSASPGPTEPTATTSTDGTAGTEDAGPVDPCDLVTRADWLPFVDKRDRKYVAELHELDLEYPSVTSCRIASPRTDAASATIGYAMDPGLWSTVKRRTKPNVLGTKRVDLPGIADEAFYATGLFGAQGFARSGHYVVVVNMYDTATVGDLSAVLRLVLAQAGPAWLTHPIDLPADCPDADDPALTRLMGPVQYARGGVFEADGRHVFCDYGAENGTSVSTEATQKRPHDFQVATGINLDPVIGKVVDPAPGRVRSVSESVDGTFGATSELPGTRTEMWTSTNPDYRMKDPRFTGDRASFIAWLDRVEQVIARSYR
ncbi:MAG: hypothetical protein JWO76_2149 [Nocardioides sp.]|nr:hypothetical protein [Nocardioides sp.]